MIRKTVPLSLVLLVAFFTSQAQIAANYEVATWSQFKTAAVTYTFDDNCSNQLPVALPLFDQYNYKVTFFAVTSWGINWPNLLKASANGHEVASHTVSHVTLSDQSSDKHESELRQSQNIINTNITNAKCLTIAYPNCAIGDVPTIQKYYIAGRNCSGSIIPSSPSNFYTLSSILTGADGAVKKAADFNSQVASAKSSKGWCVFLLHGIDGDGGYSSTQSGELKSHLATMNTNKADFWVGTFVNVVKYIKERNAADLTETAINNDSLQLTFTDNLDNAVYNTPITIRRALPANWKEASVYIGGKLATSALTTVNNKQYIVFEAVADQGKIYLSNKNKTVTSLEETTEEHKAARFTPNPFSEEAVLEAKGDFQYGVYTIDGHLIESGKGTNTLRLGHSLEPGSYMMTVKQGTMLNTIKIIKK